MTVDTIVFSLKRLIHSPLYSLLNIISLGIALACVLLVGLYVNDEFEYDGFWQDSERIYRVEMNRSYSNGDRTHTQYTFGPIVPLIESNQAEVESATRFGHFNFLVSANDNRFYENLLFTDPSVVDVFGLEFTAGDGASAFQQPNSVVITETMANKLFPSGNALHQMVWLDGKHQMQVSGVIADIPNNSHLTFSLFASMDSAKQMYGDRIINWDYANQSSYLKLTAGADPDAIEREITQLVAANAPEALSTKVELKLKPIASINLLAQDGKGLQIIYIISAVALAILLMACANVVNLATARGAERAKELGIRKAVGASRRDLFAQFIIESLILAFFALLFALIVTYYFLPLVNAMTQKSMALDLLGNMGQIGWLVFLCLVTGLLSGAYPAFMLSKFQPAHVLKGMMRFGQGSMWVRKAIVLLQFAVSVGLVIVTLIIYKQVSFMKNMDLKFEKENVVVIDNIHWTDIAPHYKTLKAELEKHPDVLSVGGSTGVPARDYNLMGTYAVKGESETSAISLNRLDMDHGFFESYDVKLLAGRLFSKDHPSDLVDPGPDSGASQFNIIINELAMRKLGFASANEAINQSIDRIQPSRLPFSFKIVGVVEDFHMLAGHGPIKPYLFLVKTNGFVHASVELSESGIAEGLAHIDSTWNSVYPQYPIIRTFIEDDLARGFEQWESYRVVMVALAIVTTIISCFGVFGLVSYSTKYQKKEISVRKVVGASAWDITVLFNLGFLKLLLLANLLAWPIAYMFASRWLSEFSYRITLEPSLFVYIGLASAALTTLITSYHTYKIANTKPALVFHTN
ncbi:ABC transporter permease [Pseudoalteromonas sp. Of7M-16]|uniref:ABC transporter permease n=1 Tax=Pseudoalteromonas sp. Of7M-16 TaxID=2917756 RepID=UPI001EF51A7F|nr:ABC transporter permease [Pseudoalteromonas sp. Of7M-16]MCG7548618.1 ABC transporter permease [Pseudoalteromonas sp. Of7M-16]